MSSAALRVSRQPVPNTLTGLQIVQVTAPPFAFVGTDAVRSAVYYNGKIYIGMVDADGNARVASYSKAKRTATVSPAIVTGLGADVHCSPTVLIRASDHKIVLAVAPHDTVPAVHMYVAVSTNAEDVSAWGSATDIKTTLAGTSYTYAHLVQLSGESGKIYLFYRDEQDTQTSGALCYSTSTDGGATWAAQTTLYKNTGKQCYWAIRSDDTSRIDFAVSDGNAKDGDTASLYHFYYTGGSYHKSDGTLISTSPPLGPSDLTKVYDGSTNGAVRVPYSIVAGPVIAWAAYDSAGSGQPEKYWYAAYSSGWTPHQIATSGSTPDPNFTEGGVAIDYLDSSRVYVSRKVSSVWQIVRYTTGDGGSTWTAKQVTNDTGVTGDVLNLRPVSPKNADSAVRCLWCFGPHYVSGGVEVFGCLIRGYPNPISAF